VLKGGLPITEGFFFRRAYADPVLEFPAVLAENSASEEKCGPLTDKVVFYVFYQTFINSLNQYYYLCNKYSSLNTIVD
jgi:hypothetical protein